MISAEDWMALRVFGCFRIYVRVAHPVRNNFGLAAGFPFRPVDQIHRAKWRLNFRLLSILLLDDISVANAFARRFDRKCLSTPRIVGVEDRIKRQLMLHVVELLVQLVVSDVDPLQSKTLR